MTYQIDSKIKMPTNIRRAVGSPSKVEQATFDAFMRQYRLTYHCQLTQGHFDAESRIQIFNGPTGFVCSHGPSRCKQLTRQMRHMKG